MGRDSWPARKPLPRLFDRLTGAILMKQLLLRFGTFRKWGGGVPYLGVLIIRILLFRVPYYGPLFSETPYRILNFKP